MVVSLHLGGSLDPCDHVFLDHIKRVIFILYNGVSHTKQVIVNALHNLLFLA